MTLHSLRLDRIWADPLTLEDAASLQALAVQCGAYFRRAHGRKVGPRLGLELLSDALGDADRRLLGLRLHEEAALSGILDLQLRHPQDDEITVVLLLLAPERRGRGLGREVVEGLIAAYRKEASALCLGVEHSGNAGPFWEALGFRVDGTEGGVTNYRLPLDAASP